jgi:uncharacterized protein
MPANRPSPTSKSYPDPDAKALIRRLGLLPHPEGGFYREIHRSRESVETGKGRRSALTTIYFLLLAGQTSVFHRVLSDEVWHYYQGAPLRLWRVPAGMKKAEAILLGPTGIRGKAAKAVQASVIQAKEWQAAETLGGYTLAGCSVGPGFDFADFTLMRDDIRSAARLRKAFPRLGRLI